jgi:peptidoglycan/LPS O-acetylase OafA/YrhL
MISLYAKAILYVALAAVTVLVTALTDNHVSVEELLNLAIVLLGAIVTYLVPNLDEGVRRYAKGIVACLTAALVALASFLTGGVTLSEWMQVVVAALAAVGVVIVPNASPSPARTVNQTIVLPDSSDPVAITAAIERARKFE